ncbi:MAG: SCO family protein [Deltaproteobacteria bacterium]|nr:SCO family protein [Deltaproteobacteria bacterium]
MIKSIVTMVFLFFSLQSLSEEKKSDESIYQLKSSWQDQTAKDVLLKNFAGKIVLITMGYTGCAHACPLIISKIKAIETELKSKKITNYHVIFVSFDTVKDRPKDLKKYIVKKELDANVWTMLSSNKEADIRELANVLGINYKDVGDGDFVHSNVITALDIKGNIIAKVETLNDEINKLIERIEEQNGR